MGESGELAAVFVGRKTSRLRFAGTVDSQQSEISLHWETTAATTILGGRSVKIWKQTLINPLERAFRVHGAVSK